ncbi:MAG: dihydroorotate dehydrogenase electron transfer subunit, partial [Planctomycetes bacterium]|nr:dihydroorotate dehydrogenase electron transfer subunit [Planctomycetota bacterium]
MWVEAPQLTCNALPGQFVTVRCGEDVLLRRPLSIHKVQGDYLALLFAVVGEGTEWLSLRSKGDFIDLLGPLGNGFKISDDSSRLLVVAGGIGIAPLIHLADRAVADDHSVKMVLGASTASQLYHEITGVDLISITEDGS